MIVCVLIGTNSPQLLQDAACYCIGMFWFLCQNGYNLDYHKCPSFGKKQIFYCFHYIPFALFVISPLLSKVCFMHEMFSKKPHFGRSSLGCLTKTDVAKTRPNAFSIEDIAITVVMVFY
jgi:hypothetical protein